MHNKSFVYSKLSSIVADEWEFQNFIFKFFVEIESFMVEIWNK